MTEHLETPENMELPPSLLPYGFARRYGVLLRERDGHKELCHRQDVSVAALGEGQRHIGRLPRLVPMDDTAFTAAMAITYEQQRGAAQFPALVTVIARARRLAERRIFKPGMLWPLTSVMCWGSRTGL